MSYPTRRYEPGAIVVFALLHVAALGIFFLPFRWELAAWLALTYAVRMFGVTAGYHRYFSHRSFKLGRTAQFLLAFLAQTSGQKGALWWAAHHRHHHRASDRENDIHSPWQSGFWWSHVGWVIANDYDGFEPARIPDFARYPELLWLNRFHWVPAVVFALAVLLAGGWDAFFWGFALSTVVLYHGTFTINSLCHLIGSKRFATGDESRNNFVLALITMGEGWHNNHHYSPGACRQGLRWWEIDVTYYILVILSWLGIARDLRPFRETAQRDSRAA
jgi:stearoyl-CoA desaturase (Delta-9 desaturase)